MTWPAWTQRLVHREPSGQVSQRPADAHRSGVLAGCLQGPRGWRPWAGTCGWGQTVRERAGGAQQLPAAGELQHRPPKVTYLRKRDTDFCLRAGEILTGRPTGHAWRALQPGQQSRQCPAAEFEGGSQKAPYPLGQDTRAGAA